MEGRQDFSGARVRLRLVVDVVVVWFRFPTNQDRKKTLKNPLLFLSKMAPIPFWAEHDCEKSGRRQDGIGAQHNNHGGDHGGVGRGVWYIAQGSKPGQASGAGLVGARGALKACGETRSVGGVIQ